MRQYYYCQTWEINSARDHSTLTEYQRYFETIWALILNLTLINHNTRLAATSIDKYDTLLFCTVWQQPVWTAYSYTWSFAGLLSRIWPLNKTTRGSWERLLLSCKSAVSLQQGQCSSMCPTLQLHPAELASDGHCSTQRMLSWIALVPLQQTHFLPGAQESLHHLTVQGLSVNLCMPVLCPLENALCRGSSSQSLSVLPAASGRLDSEKWVLSFTAEITFQIGVNREIQKVLIQ